MNGIRHDVNTYVYCKVKNFLEKTHDDEWKKFGVWSAFEKVAQEAEVEVPSKPDAGM